MFGLSKRRMKIGRLKVQLGDSNQGTRSPMRPPKRLGNNNGDSSETTQHANYPPDDLHFQTTAAACNLSKFNTENNDKWVVVSTSGEKPRPRAHHAAAVIGSKMVIVGGESGHELLDDTQVLNLEKLTWAAANPKVYLSPTGLPRKIPACKGHNLISWGKKMLLIGGKTDPIADKISVWSFDLETECWSLVEAKGDVPSARSGHTVVRAGTYLILFGGEDLKGRKLNDLHMLDMKSSMWLPLIYTGTGPSPRCNHVAALYDDRILFVFGGQSKSRILNDLYSLDFETMVWSRIKIQGHHPSPRAGCRGVLCGTKWYISGGGSKKKRHAETLAFDIVKLEMSVAISSTPTSIITNKGFSLVAVHHREKVFLVAFGGTKKDPSNQVEILVMEKDENSMGWRLAPDKDPLSFENFPANAVELASHMKSNCPPCSNNSVGRNSLASAIGQHSSARRSLSETNVEPNLSNASVSLRKQFHHDGERVSAVKLQKALEDEKYKETDDYSQSQVTEQKNKMPETVVKVDTAGGCSADDTYILDSQPLDSYQKYGTGNPPPDSDDIISPETDTKSLITTPSNRYQLYEAKIATLVRKNVQLEGQLATALVSHENTEKNLSSTVKTRQELERKLADALKEVEALKEKVTTLELAQEEANNLSNIVHSDNVRLEHDVAFLKAVLDDTQKELHSTRGVLAGERARAFQLQVEVFHLKQRLQSLETRAPTPRKPFQV